MALHSRRSRTVLLAALAISAACGDALAPERRPEIALVGDYGFVVEHHDQFHVVGGPGQGNDLVLPTGVVGLMPDVSADGTRIAFVNPVPAGGGFRLQLATIGVDGAGMQVVSAPSESVLWPRWSADGTQIAFAMSSSDATFYDDLVVRPAAGGAGRHVIESRWDAVRRAAWSPDGRQLVFEREAAGLWLIGVDGTGLRQLTTSADGHPDWSPDGARIAFERLGAGSRSVCIRTLATGMEVCVAIAGWGSRPRWSPDGQWLALLGDDGGLYTVNPAGTGLVERIPGRWMGSADYDWVKLR